MHFYTDSAYAGENIMEPVHTVGNIYALSYREYYNVLM